MNLARTALRTAILTSLGLLGACGGETNGGGTGSAAGAGSTGAGASPSGGHGGGTSGGAAGGGAAGGGATGGGAAGGGAAGGGAGTAGSGSGGSATFACGLGSPSPQYLGIEVCDAGGLRRTAAVACTNTLPRADQYCAMQPSSAGACKLDSDCTEKPYGMCDLPYPGPCACHYGCLTDDDCGAGGACICGAGALGQCVAATCRTNADCPSGACRLDQSNGCGALSLGCAIAADACDGPGDCKTNGPTCSRVNGVFSCGGQCATGRPLVLRGAFVIAPLQQDADPHWAR